jgi:hypothetical protein
MTARETARRGEAVLTLLRRLGQRPVIGPVSGMESIAELLVRIDTPGHAARLEKEQYARLLLIEDVAWKSVLAFFAQPPVGGDIRAYWADPVRRAYFGCLLDEDDIQILSPFFIGPRGGRGGGVPFIGPRRPAATLRLLPPPRTPSGEPARCDGDHGPLGRDIEPVAADAEGRAPAGCDGWDWPAPADRPAGIPRRPT